MTFALMCIVQCHCLYPQWFSPEVSDDAGNDPLCLLHHLHARLHCQNGKATFTFNEYQLAPSPHISSTYWKCGLFTRSLTNVTCTPQCTRSPTCSTGPLSGSTQSSTSWPRGSTRLKESMSRNISILMFLRMQWSICSREWRPSLEFKHRTSRFHLST